MFQYTCIEEGELVGVAGRNGVAHYSLKNRRWYLFGNESQERDFVVTGGLLWLVISYLYKCIVAIVAAGIYLVNKSQE